MKFKIGKLRSCIQTLGEYLKESEQYPQGPCVGRACVLSTVLGPSALQTWFRSLVMPGFRVQGDAELPQVCLM